MATDIQNFIEFYEGEISPKVQDLIGRMQALEFVWDEASRLRDKIFDLGSDMREQGFDFDPDSPDPRKIMRAKVEVMEAGYHTASNNLDNEIKKLTGLDAEFFKKFHEYLVDEANAAAEHAAEIAFGC